MSKILTVTGIILSKFRSLLQSLAKQKNEVCIDFTNICLQIWVNRHFKNARCFCLCVSISLSYFGIRKRVLMRCTKWPTAATDELCSARKLVNFISTKQTMLLVFNSIFYMKKLADFWICTAARFFVRVEPSLQRLRSVFPWYAIKTDLRQTEQWKL